MRKVLVAGWFSFENMGASAGDLITRDLVCEWLRVADCRYDVALAPPFYGGVEWEKMNPRDYSRVIYLHEWNGKPFYWGKAHNSFFGGHKRKLNGLEASGRYNAGYRH